MSNTPEPVPTRTWLAVSAAAAVGTLLFAAFFVAYADRLALLTGPVYYVLLVLVALGAAAVLFGALRSRARYQGQVHAGKLQMSGAVVVFAGIVAGGVAYTSPEDTSSITVRVYDAEHRDRMITGGEIVLDLGDDRRTRSIGPDGQATFAQVPLKFLSGEVNVIPRVERYRATAAGPYRVSAARVIEVGMTRVPDSTEVAGAVVDGLGPVSGALVNFANGRVTTRTDENGNFRVVLPYGSGTVVPVTVVLAGRTAYDEDYVVSDGVGLRIRVAPASP
jgi:hypothetical protein